MTITDIGSSLETKLIKALTELPAAYDQLHLFTLPGSRPNDGSKPRRGTLSTRAPLILDVLALLDERHKSECELTRHCGHVPPCPYSDFDTDKMAGARRMGILPTLAQWVRLIDAELWDAEIHHTEPVEHPTVATECAWLRGHTDWISNQPWIVDIVDDLHRMLRDVNQIVGAEQEVRYYCTKCGWPIQERDNGSWFHCSGCDQNWTRLELHRMAERKKPKTLADIAKMTDISLRTLRAYADRGHLKVVAREGRTSLYDLDAVALATMNLKYKREPIRFA